MTMSGSWRSTSAVASGALAACRGSNPQLCKITAKEALMPGSSSTMRIFRFRAVTAIKYTLSPWKKAGWGPMGSVKYVYAPKDGHETQAGIAQGETKDQRAGGTGLQAGDFS